MHREPQSRTKTTSKPCPLSQSNPFRKNTKAPDSGAFSVLNRFFVSLCENWHAACNSPFSDSVHYPVSGTLVQAGRGFPSLHRAHTALATSPPVLGPLIQAGQGFLLYTRLTPHSRRASRFGDLGTGRPGIPSFIAPADESPAASGYQPHYRPSRPAGAGPPPVSATTRHHSIAPASSRPCRPT